MGNSVVKGKLLCYKGSNIKEENVYPIPINVRSFATALSEASEPRVTVTELHTYTKIARLSNEVVNEQKVGERHDQAVRYKHTTSPLKSEFSWLCPTDAWQKDEKFSEWPKSPIDPSIGATKQMVEEMVPLVGYVGTGKDDENEKIKDEVHYKSNTRNSLASLRNLEKNIDQNEQDCDSRKNVDRNVGDNENTHSLENEKGDVGANKNTYKLENEIGNGEEGNCTVEEMKVGKKKMSPENRLPHDFAISQDHSALYQRRTNGKIGRNEENMAEVHTSLQEMILQ